MKLNFTTGEHFTPTDLTLNSAQYQHNQQIIHQYLLKSIHQSPDKMQYADQEVMLADIRGKTLESASTIMTLPNHPRQRTLVANQYIPPGTILGGFFGTMVPSKLLNNTIINWSHYKFCLEFCPDPQTKGENLLENFSYKLGIDKPIVHDPIAIIPCYHPLAQSCPDKHTLLPGLINHGFPENDIEQHFQFYDEKDKAAAAVANIRMIKLKSTYARQQQYYPVEISLFISTRPIEPQQPLLWDYGKPYYKNASFTSKLFQQQDGLWLPSHLYYPLYFNLPIPPKAPIPHPVSMSFFVYRLSIQQLHLLYTGKKRHHQSVIDRINQQFHHRYKKVQERPYAQYMQPKPITVTLLRQLIEDAEIMLPYFSHQPPFETSSIRRMRIKQIEKNFYQQAPTAKSHHGLWIVALLITCILSNVAYHRYHLFGEPAVTIPLGIGFIGFFAMAICLYKVKSY